MTYEPKNPSRPFLTSFNPGEPIAEQRARIAREHTEREEQRQAELTELTSIHNNPGDRIRRWERMFGLTLPRDPNHNILEVIAAATDLEQAQVREEQQRRHPAR